MFKSFWDPRGIVSTQAKVGREGSAMSAQVMETTQMLLDDAERIVSEARQRVRSDWTGLVKRRIRELIKDYRTHRDAGSCHDSAVATTLKNAGCCQKAKSEFERLMARARKAANNAVRRKAADREYAA